MGRITSLFCCIAIAYSSAYASKEQMKQSSTIIANEAACTDLANKTSSDIGTSSEKTESKHSVRHTNIKGKVTDAEGEALPAATVYIEGSSTGTVTDENGYYEIRDVPARGILSVSYLGYQTKNQPIISHKKEQQIDFVLNTNQTQLNEVEVFGNRYHEQEKLDIISRIPLRPNEQIQSIAVISDKVIQQQGILNVTDAAKNIAGVSSFSTYGGASESLSARGYRGIPTLKNGVKVNSDFRGQGSLTDMQGIESVQMIKGASAITQGLASDLGSGGGVINLATKTPKFIDKTDISLRIGSWGLIRPTFDLQKVVNNSETVAIRLNGAYEQGDSYRANVSKSRFYINPSIEWRPNAKTTFTLEMDYLHDSRTPDRGTINLAPDSINALYSLPHSQFTGFTTDRVLTQNLTYAARFLYQLSDNLSVRVGYYASILDKNSTGASLSTLKELKQTGEYNKRSRSITRSDLSDHNQTVQIDLIGRDLFTGNIKHTFQLGMDFQRSKTTSTAYNSVLVDTIDIFKPISNTLPEGITMSARNPEQTIDFNYGAMAQDVITFNPYLTAVAGIRYSHAQSFPQSGGMKDIGGAWNPMTGIIITPFKGIHLFASYSNSTNLNSASNLMEDGSSVGASVANQFETGIKSEYFNNRLRFNLTLFRISNNNLSYLIYDDNWVSTNRYAKAGELRRQGIETELSGHLTNNMEMILGYAYLDAAYHNSPAYVEGSRPMNAPKHTANGWLNYRFSNGLLKGITLGAGAFYTGSRPVNDYSMKATHTNTQPGVKPFNMNAFTTINSKIGYHRQNFDINVFFNNITNAEGYSSYYRGGFINPIDQFNMGAQMTYHF